MAPPTTAATVATLVSTVAVVIGAGIALFARRAAKRHDSRPLRLFACGFAVITVGLLVGTVAGLVLGWGAVESLVVQGVLVALGFALLARSLFVATGREDPTLR